MALMLVGGVILYIYLIIILLWKPLSLPTTVMVTIQGPHLINQ